MKSDWDEKLKQSKELLEAFSMLPEDKAQKFTWMVKGAAMVSEGLKESRREQKEATS